ncbi:hypothetical protein [Flavobacterium sp.]|uniref:hypothetical protein n=1 Tax=Flavobacterium sp. TaxID=239 RepID=UPI00374D530C
MKKFIVLSFLFINYLGYSQIKVIETVPIEKIGRIGANGTSDIYIQKEGNEYTVSFKNIEDVDNGNVKFNFKDLAGDFENLYTIISNGFNASPVADIKLDLPNDIIWLHYTKSLQKMVTLQFMTKNKLTAATGISDSMTKADVNNLFGKK